MKRLLVLIILISGALSASVFAHQQRAAITKVLFNKNSGNLEVMHRFYMHDAEHAVRQIFGKDADIIGSAETQSVFADYVSERFALTSGETSLPLSPVGFEIERVFFWVYQETPMVSGIDDLTIKHDALRDVWPHQINTVNIEGLGDVKTATFDGSVEILTLDLK